MFGSLCFLFVLSDPWCGLQGQIGVGISSSPIRFWVFLLPGAISCACVWESVLNVCASLVLFLVLLLGYRVALPAGTRCTVIKMIETEGAHCYGALDMRYWSPYCHEKIWLRLTHYHVRLISLIHRNWKSLGSCIHTQNFIRLGWMPATPRLEHAGVLAHPNAVSSVSHKLPNTGRSFNTRKHRKKKHKLSSTSTGCRTRKAQQQAPTPKHKQKCSATTAPKTHPQTHSTSQARKNRNLVTSSTRKAQEVWVVCVWPEQLGDPSPVLLLGP